MFKIGVPRPQHSVLGSRSLPWRVHSFFLPVLAASFWSEESDPSRCWLTFILLHWICEIVHFCAVTDRHYNIAVSYYAYFQCIYLPKFVHIFFIWSMCMLFKVCGYNKFLKNFLFCICLLFQLMAHTQQCSGLHTDPDSALGWPLVVPDSAACKALLYYVSDPPSHSLKRKFYFFKLMHHDLQSYSC